MKKVTFLAAALMALVLMAAPSGAQYSDDDFNATISDVVVVAGESVTISGYTILSDEVAITFDDEPVSRAIVPLGTIPVNADGTFSGNVTIPSVAPGFYSLYATSGSEVLTIDVEVVAAAADPGTGGTGTDTLARTGSATDTLAKVGGGLILAGAAAMLLASKRRATA